MNTTDYNRIRKALNNDAGASFTIEEFSAMNTKQKKSTLRKLIQITDLKESNLRDFGMIRKSYALSKLKKNRRIKSVEDIAKLTPNQMTREANIILNFIAAESSTPYGILSREQSINKMIDDGYSKKTAREQKRFWNLADRIRDVAIMSNIYGDIGSDVTLKALFEFYDKVRSDNTVRDWDSYTDDELEDLIREKLNEPMSEGQKALRQARKFKTDRDSVRRALGFSSKANSKNKPGKTKKLGVW